LIVAAIGPKELVVKRRDNTVKKKRLCKTSIANDHGGGPWLIAPTTNAVRLFVPTGTSVRATNTNLAVPSDTASLDFRRIDWQLWPLPRKRRYSKFRFVPAVGHSGEMVN